MLRFLFGKLSTRHPGIVEKNLKIAFPNQSAEDRTQLIQKIYRHFSNIFIDIIYIFVRKKPEKFLKPIEIKNIEYLDRAIRKNRGVILFSGHFGNWELVPYILNREKGVKLNSIARRMNNRLVENRVLKFREFMGSSVIDKNNAVRTMLKRLEQNEIVYLLIDQNTIEREAVFVEFFNRTVSAVPTVSLLHIKKNIPVVPLFLHYEEDKIVLQFLEELAADSIIKQAGENGPQTPAERVRCLTQHCTAIIEENIQKYPEQWFWFHNRWKTSPPKKEEKIVSPDTGPARRYRAGGNS